jgi:HK97 family phage major capsid protein/HK97 family phage prohead protease
MKTPTTTTTQNNNEAKLMQGYRNATIAMPAEVTEENSRSVEVVFGTETEGVMRYDWSRDEVFVEVLDFSPSSVRMTRFEQGVVPVLDNHDRYGGVRSQLGKAENARLEDGRGLATIRFSNRTEVDGIVQDVRDGILTGISVGYRVNKYKRDGKTADGVPRRRAVDWEPLEISLAPVPADGESRVRATEQTEYHLAVIEGEEERAVSVAAAPASPDNEPQPAATRESADKKEPIAARGSVVNKNKQYRMKTVTELRQLRAAKADELAGIVEGARSANVELTDEQATRKAALVGEIEAVEAQIREAEATERIMAERTARAAAGAQAGNSEQKEKKAMASQFSIARAALKIANGEQLDGIEAEVTQYGRSQGSTGGEIVLPFDFVRAGGADDFQAASGSGSGAVATQVPEYIAALYAPLLLEQLGAITMRGLSSDLKMPRTTVKASATAETEVSEAASSGLNIGELTMAPKRYASFSKISRQLQIQSAVGIDAAIMRELRMGFEAKINVDCLTGASGGDNIVGLINTVGVNTLTPADNTDYAAIVGALYQLVLANHGLTAASRWALSPEAHNLFDNAVQVTGVKALLNNNQLKGLPYMASPYLPDASAGVGRALFGDFSGLMVGYWGAGIEFIIDPYSLKKFSQIEIQAVQYVDLGVAQPSGFAVCSDISES